MPEGDATFQAFGYEHHLKRVVSGCWSAASEALIKHVRNKAGQRGVEKQNAQMRSRSVFTNSVLPSLRTSYRQRYRFQHMSVGRSEPGRSAIAHSRIDEPETKGWRTERGAAAVRRREGGASLRVRRTTSNHQQPFRTTRESVRGKKDGH